MKRAVIAGLLALSVSVMADSAQDVLRKAREDYYKQQKEMSKPVKEKKIQEKVVKKEMKVTSEEMTEETVMVEEEMVEEVKPKTPMEKLEYNAAKARDRVDFYERVVRSVEREEKELGVYNDVLGKNKKSRKPVVKKVQKETVKKGQKKK
ncbi:MAG: hypothetical protein Q4D53_08465 [Leptotrichiaceae bacterium]|nr:hypothetical protein [Leptotrichiaceae bacterium]